MVAYGLSSSRRFNVIAFPPFTLWVLVRSQDLCMSFFLRFNILVNSDSYTVSTISSLKEQRNSSCLNSFTNSSFLTAALAVTAYRKKIEVHKHALVSMKT